MLSDSKLGFGLMRLPKDDNGVIILDQVQAMVDAFMEKGFTYFDTAYAYAGSEEAMRKTLVERYPRDSFTIADKLPAWKLKREDPVWDGAEVSFFAVCFPTAAYWNPISEEIRRI